MQIIQKDFIFNEPLPTPQCHASTIVVFENGNAIAAWFGGTKESHPDVRIWYSRYENGIWCTPTAIPSEEVVPHWNPVLFQTDDKMVTLYYKKGFKIPDWKTMVVTSADFGKTWSAPRELVENDTSGGRGPVKNKPIALADGTILAPASTEQGSWRCFIDTFDGHMWCKHPIPVNSEDENLVQLIQPAIWQSAEDCVHVLMRSANGSIYRSDSCDGGKNWCTAYPIPIPNNNSGIDCAVCNGKLVLVCNPVRENWGKRSPLTVFISEDNGTTFQKLLDLETEPGEYSYPAIVSHGNYVYITYTYQRTKIAFCKLQINS